MRRWARNIILISIALVIIPLGFFKVVLLVFDGAFDIDLHDNFLKHESEFAEAVTYFDSITPKDKNQTIRFEVFKNDKIGLLLLQQDAIDGFCENNLEINSPKLDSILSVLGWTEETVKILSSKLSKTNCKWITLNPYELNPENKYQIELYPKQLGMIMHHYVVLQQPISDTIVYLYGKRLSNTELGKRTKMY